MGLTFGLFPLGGIEFITLYMLSPELVDSEIKQKKLFHSDELDTDDKSIITLSTI